MTDLAKRLNPGQFQAVHAIDGPVLVIAGAGSGKTRVIEYRVLNLVESRIDPHSILLLTFTRHASREMISRASRHNADCRNVEGGTFHSFAFRLLRRYGKAIALPESFIVLDEGDAEEAVHRSTTKLKLHDQKKRFPRKDTLRSIISMATNKQSSIGDVLKRDYPHFMEYAAEIEQIRRDFVAYKLEKGYLDYDDLLVYLRILLDHEEMRDRLSRKYRYIMVDEFQDVNALQGDIACILAGGHRNIMVVGDDAQSIYGFRGASHETIMDFPRRFPDCTIIKLEENFRSTQVVLDVANAVLENMKNKYSKCLVSARKLTGARPELLFFRNIHEEAEWIADAIKKRIDEGIPLHHQCVLFRSLYLSIPLQTELSRRNIPYETRGGIKFYETAHVKDLMAHLKVVANPRDELAWNRVLMLIERIGPKTAAHLTERFTLYPSLAEALSKEFPQQVKGHIYSERLGQLEGALSAVLRSTQVGEQFGLILEYYQPILRDAYDDWHVRINDLEALRQIAMRYGTLDELLEDFTIEPPVRGVWRIEPETKDEDEPLVLSTIHSAKGLEWDTVYIMGLADGVLPVTFALDHEDDIEEERRLFYVAITRAKNTLFLSLHHEGFRNGITQFNKLSRFVDVPNVLARLEYQEYYRTQPPDRLSSDDETEIDTVYDRERLLDRLTRFYR